MLQVTLCIFTWLGLPLGSSILPRYWSSLSVRERISHNDTYVFIAKMTSYCVILMILMIVIETSIGLRSDFSH
jgi:hypothetical protein